MSWFLDSDVCIGCLHNSTPLVKEELMGLEPAQIKIAAMVKAELLLGAEKSTKSTQNKQLVELFLSPFEIVAFDDAAASVYGRIRAQLEKAGQIIGFNDLIIAATVLSHEGTLVSGNLREFSRIKELKLENWAEV